MNQISLQLTENSQKSRYMIILEKMAQAEIDANCIDRKLWSLSKEKDAIYAKPDFSEEDGMKAAKLEERFALDLRKLL